MALVVLVLAGSAHAAFPGRNGKIAFHRLNQVERQNEIWTADPDGSNLTRIVVNGFWPAWSPDGQKIAFTRFVTVAGDPLPTRYWTFIANADGSGETAVGEGYAPGWSPDGNRLVVTRPAPGSYDNDLFVMNTDGTGVARVTNNFNGSCGVPDDQAKWSPGGTRILFVSLRRDCAPQDGRTDIFTINPDGTDERRLTTLRLHYSPDWSPDGAHIVLIRREGRNDRVWTMNPDGTDLVNISQSSTPEFLARWSPDGSKIVFWRYIDGYAVTLWTMNPDGSDQEQIVEGVGDMGLDWQPIPINSYARPKGATPTRLSLVPAYKPCTLPNGEHGPPLVTGSCSPPGIASDYLTTGRDANGEVPRMVGFTRIGVLVGKAATAEDEADVTLQLRLSDVRNKDLSDYAGELEARPVIRITDKDNTPSPGGPGAATTADTPFPFTVPCTTTATDTTIGSLCSVLTSADAVLPGVIKEERRSIWQLGRFDVYDGGADGDADTTSDNTLFVTEGIFVP